ncbi:gamma-mobile-trio protein GmtX [Duganella qianjiadongensis]|uniref:gamma-mobile-trio protein GmtX n=1 Tax=Duganella qianjiadongensis TaxID=2692176 RepID=UPI00353090AA
MERLCEFGRRRFCVDLLGILSEAAGGPAAAAVRDKTGDDYKALIKTFAGAVDGKSRKASKRKRSVLYDILEGVSDPVLRTRIGILLAELESARGQITALRHLASQHAVVYLDGPDTATCSDVLTPPFDLAQQERNVLERAIAPATLMHWGWVAEPNGWLKTDTGQVVYPAGYITAIQKVLGR